MMIVDDEFNIFRVNVLKKLIYHIITFVTCMFILKVFNFIWFISVYYYVIYEYNADSTENL